MRLAASRTVRAESVTRNAQPRKRLVIRREGVCCPRFPPHGLTPGPCRYATHTTSGCTDSSEAVLLFSRTTQPPLVGYVEFMFTAVLNELDSPPPPTATVPDGQATNTDVCENAPLVTAEPGKKP